MTSADHLLHPSKTPAPTDGVFAWIPARWGRLLLCGAVWALCLAPGSWAGATPPKKSAAPPPDTPPSPVTIVRCGDPSQPKVALTFDDGPTKRYTPQILKVLRREKVKATFFVLGRAARRHPELVRRLAAEGHLVANHTWSHPKRGDAQLWQDQIARTQKALGKIGVSANPFFRPAHGIVNPAVTQACAAEHCTIVLFTLLSSDWREPGVDQLVHQALRRLAAGGIAVYHDGGGNRSQTVQALPRIIRGLRKKGLEPVRLDELLGPEPKQWTCARPSPG